MFFYGELLLPSFILRTEINGALYINVTFSYEAKLDVS